VNCRLRLHLGINELLNNSAESDFEELVFWGRIDGMQHEYYICMGVTFTDKYEFPTKRFYWASSADFRFKAFPALNDQHRERVDEFLGPFTGDHTTVHIRVEPELT